MKGPEPCFVFSCRYCWKRLALPTRLAEASGLCPWCRMRITGPEAAQRWPVRILGRYPQDDESEPFFIAPDDEDQPSPRKISKVTAGVVGIIFLVAGFLYFMATSPVPHGMPPAGPGDIEGTVNRRISKGDSHLEAGEYTAATECYREAVGELTYLARFRAGLESRDLHPVESRLNLAVAAEILSRHEGTFKGR